MRLRVEADGTVTLTIRWQDRNAICRALVEASTHFKARSMFDAAKEYDELCEQVERANRIVIE